MKLPDIFHIRISTFELENISPMSAIILRTYFSGRNSKDLLEKVPIHFTFAKNYYNGGRYAYNDQYKLSIFLQKSFIGENDEIRDIVLQFKKDEKK